jgi:hypothetical protein
LAPDIKEHERLTRSVPGEQAKARENIVMVVETSDPKRWDASSDG